MNAPRWFWRLIHFGPRLAYRIGLGPIIGRFVLLLTTRGRRSGRPRVTPLVYEEVDGLFIVASARGSSADWLRNIRADSRVTVEVKHRRFDGEALMVTDPEPMADYLQRQLVRHPTAFGAILRSEGLPFRPSRADLVRFAPSRPMVTIRPLDAQALPQSGS